MTNRPVRALTVVAVASLALCIGCGHGTPGPPQSEQSGSADVAGLPLTNGPSGPRPGVPHATRAVVGATQEPADVLAIDSVAEVEDFWTAAYPKAFSGSFRPVDNYQSYVAGGPDLLCGLPAIPNAMYVPSCNAILWDRGKLLPRLMSDFGQMAPTLVLAHEYGHAVQNAAGLVQEQTPTIVKEQQADCFAGLVMRHLAEGKGKWFTLNTTDGLSSVLAAMLWLRDRVPGPSAEEHGSAFDRVGAFKIGFGTGVDGCKKITKEEIEARRGDLPQIFRNPETGGQLPVTQQSVEIVIDSLDKFFKLPKKPHVDFSAERPNCSGMKPTPPVTYCAKTNEIAIDLPGLAKRGEPPTNPRDTTVRGDHNAYVLVASRYALAAITEGGAAATGTKAALRAVCYAGAWTAALAQGLSDVLVLSPGDLDEAVSGLLTDGLAASDANGEPVPSGFVRVDAFEEGVLHGKSKCDDRFK